MKGFYAAALGTTVAAGGPWLDLAELGVMPTKIARGSGLVAYGEF